MENPHFTQKDRDNLERLSKGLLEHSKEDEKSFSGMNDGIAELKSMLINQNRDFKEHSELVVAHMKRVEPVVKAYEDALVVKKNTDKIGEEVVTWGKRIGAVAIIGSALLYILSTFLIRK